MTRTCTRCHRNLPESEFYSPRWAKCRECAREISRERRANGGTTNRRQRRAANVATPIAFDARSRRFGIELEVTGISRSAAAAALVRAGLSAAAESYNHRRVAHWKVVDDASVYSGCEIVSPPLTQDRMGEVETAMRALRDAGATVGRSTGMHVHHDADGLDVATIRRVVEIYAANERHILSVLSPSRTNNPYCGSVGTILASVRRATTAYDLHHLNRYVGVNLQSLGRHGTIELRAHQGSLNFAKASNWIRLGQAIVQAAHDGTTVDASTFETFIATLPLTESERDFFTGRRAVLARRSGRAA